MNVGILQLKANTAREARAIPRVAPIVTSPGAAKRPEVSPRNASTFDALPYLVYRRV